MTIKALRLVLAAPIKPNTAPELRRRFLDSLGTLRASNPSLDINLFVDDRLEKAELTDRTPWSRVTRVRNRMIESLGSLGWNRYDYVMWLDADLVSFPPDLPTRLIASSDGGIAAPLVLVEDTDRFYDTSAFIQAGTSEIEPDNPARISGRNLQHDPPYWSPCLPGAVVMAMDCVGSAYVVPVEVYRRGARHVDHTSFTDHFSICQAAKSMGLGVVCDRRLAVYHANLPKWGESWH